MGAIVSAAVALLGSAAPFLTGTSAIGSAINLIATILPPAIQLATDEIPVIKGVIATLRGNKSITEQQMNDLDALDAQCDARLDAAIAKAEGDDAGV